MQVKKYLHDNKELFNKVAQRQEVWNKFMELERKAKVGLRKISIYRHVMKIDKLVISTSHRTPPVYLMQGAQVCWWRRRRGTRWSDVNSEEMKR